MKFYKTTNAEVGEGVEATVVYHKDNGDELVCVREGFSSFEQTNPDAEEQTTEQADKLIEKASVKIAVPTKTEVRKEKTLTKEEIRAEVLDEKTPTMDIAAIEEKDSEGNPIQKLTYFEHREITSVEDFLKAQEDQQKEPEPVEVKDEAKAEPEISVEEKL